MKTKNPAFLSLISVLSVLSGLALLPAHAGRGQAKAAGTSGDVPVVRIPKKPAPVPGLPSALDLKADLVIGRESGDENYMFSELRSVGVDREDNIYALDMKEIKVRVFDKTGRHLRTFGKKGKGPGEIDRPMRMEMTQAGQLVIEDFGSGKFVFFALDGTVAKEIPLGKYQFLLRFKMNDRGEIYADTRTYGETGFVAEIIKFSPDFKPLATLASFEWKRPASDRVVRPFSPSFLLQLTAKGDLVLAMGDTDKYEFSVMNADGAPIRRIVKDYTPARVAGPAKKRLLDESGELPPGYTIDLPGEFPAFYYFIIDDRDRLFVRTYEYEEKADGPWMFYDVFDTAGRCLARFSLPERELAFISRNNKLYSMIQENEEGYPQVKRYDMIWK